MRVGICTNIDLLNDAHAAGFDCAELGAYALLPDEDESAFAPVRDTILASPIPVEAFSSFLPPECKVTGPDVDLIAVAKRMDTVLRRASEVGAEVVVFGSGGARRFPDGFPVDVAWKQLEDAARMAAETASRYGVTIAMEPLFSRACNILNTVEEGIAFVDRVSHPNCRLLADLYHMAEENEPFSSITATGDRLAHIHIPTPDVFDGKTGANYDFAGFIGALKEAGYQGRVSVEDNNRILADNQPPMTSAYRAVRERIESLVRE